LSHGLKKLGKELLSLTFLEVIKDLLKLIFAAALGGGAAALTAQLVPILRPIKWYLVIALAAGLSWGMIVVTRRFGRFRPMFPDIDPDFWIVQKRLKYRYVDREHMTYSKTVRLRALKDGLTLYRDKYRWTGSGVASIVTTNREHEFVDTARKSVWQLYEVRFDKSLRRNELVDAEVVWSLHDPQHTAVPFFSATVEEPTDILTLQVRLNPQLGVREVICEHSSSIGAKRPFQETRHPLNDDGEFTWNIETPKLLHHYEIRWKLPPTPEPYVHS